MRQYYRKHLEPEGAVSGDPFEMGHGYFHRSWGGADEPGKPLVTLLMRAIWELRKDIQEHFPDLQGAGRWDYAYWFSEELAVDFGAPECCTDLVRQSLYGATGERPHKPFWNPFRLSRWARRILPRRTQQEMYDLAHPTPGSTAPRRGLLRRVAGWLPGPVKRRIKAIMMPKPATPPIPRQRTLPPPRGSTEGFCLGFYDKEPSVATTGLAWMGPDATVRIVKPHAGTLRVTGEYSPEFFEQSGLSRRTVLRAIVGTGTLGELALEDPGRFEMVVRFPEPLSPRHVVLTLSADQSFVPAEIGLAEDTRKLSVHIGRITLNDDVLLDFARVPNAFMPDAELISGRTAFNLVGYLRSEMGIGESARLCAAAADAAGIAYSLVDFNVGCSSRDRDTRLAHRITDENPYPVNLFHINADQMPLACQCLGARFFRDRYNIGFWHWELPEFPDDWLPGFNVLQEVWVPSRFVQDAVTPKSPVPVVRIPHAVAFTVPDGLRRADLGLADGKFLFLTMYDMHSFQSRKNPQAAVEAFRRAFPDARDVGLVIKTMNTATYPDEWATLEFRLRAIPGVVIINRTFTRQEVYNLESLCDAFVSLHRSEGFGLGFAECMYLGKPVVGTNWSGNVDFMDETNSCPVKYTLIDLDRDYGPYKKGQHWADADVDHAAWYLRKLVEDAEFRRRIAEAGRQTIRTRFSRRGVGELYRKRLKIIAKQL